MKPINLILLQTMIDQGFVNVQKHPTAPLYIYNYTAKVQYDLVWNEITLACRGLILDEHKNIVARPFEKFFNLGEIQHQQIPTEPYEVFEKMDGSLGILYWVNDTPAIATRGSFTSPQAIKATQILHEKYADTFEYLDKTKTYLFEIIYPENRIVLDYGATTDLILLGIVDMLTGAEQALQSIGFPLVQQYDGVKDINTLQALNYDNKEGFVIKFKNGLRLKVKFAEYLRIHKIVTNVSNIIIWEHLLNDLPMDELLDKVPDEFYNWVKKVIATLQNQFVEIENICKAEFKQLPTQKECALYYYTCSYPKILFLMMNNKNYNSVIWKMIRPTFCKPYQTEQ